MTPERVAALPGKRKGGVAALEVMEQHLRTRALLRRRRVHDRRHRALRVHARRARRRLRPGALPRRPRLAGARRRSAAAHPDHRLARGPADGRPDRDFSVAVSRRTRGPARCGQIASARRDSPTGNVIAIRRRRHTRCYSRGAMRRWPLFIRPAHSCRGAGRGLRRRHRAARPARSRATTPTTGPLCASGQICTVAGTGIAGDGADGLPGARDAPLPAAGHDGRPRRAALRRRLEQPPHPRDRRRRDDAHRRRHRRAGPRRRRSVDATG